MLAEALAKLVPLGLKVAQAEVRSRLGLAEPTDGQDMLGKSDGPEKQHRESRRAEARAEDTGGQDAINNVAAIAAADWEPVMNPVIEPVISAAERAAGPEDFHSRITGTADTMDTDPLTRALHRHTFSSALSAQAGLADNNKADHDDHDDT